MNAKKETAKKKPSPIRQLVTAPQNWFAAIEDVLLPIPCFALLESGEVIPLVFDSEKKEMVNALTLEDFDDLLYATTQPPEQEEEEEEEEDEDLSSEEEESSDDEDSDDEDSEDSDDEEEDDDDEEKKEE